MSRLTLYHIVPSRSAVVHWMLEEVGEPFELHVLDMARGENRTSDYLAINPMGKVPALVHDGVAITEVAAICTYLADAFPRAGLSVPIGAPHRGVYLKWLFFGPSCIEPAMTDHRFPRPESPPRTALGYGDYETTMDVVAKAVAPGPYLMGEQFTAADVVIGSDLRYGMMFKMVPERPEFLDYVARLAARPAFQRAQAKDEKLSKD